MGWRLRDTNSCSTLGSVASAAGPMLELSVGTLRQARTLCPSSMATLQNSYDSHSQLTTQRSSCSAVLWLKPRRSCLERTRSSFPSCATVEQLRN